jgi:McbB family protein
VYIINDYQITLIKSDTYIYSDNKAAKISNQILSQIFLELQQKDKLEISEDDLLDLANKFQTNHEQLKKILIQQLNILKPLVSKKFSTIYINANDSLVSSLLSDSLKDRYHVEVVAENFVDYKSGSLLIFYRSNYSSHDFKRMYHNLPDDVYVITAGIIHKILLIDNLYFNGSGLPTHVSNLHQLMAYLNSELPATKDNWLLFYRSMVKNNIDEFPNPRINPCQQGFVAYALLQFASQFTNFGSSPTPLDQINWFWHVDLTSFNVHREVAIHSPFSEYDMKLNLANLKQPELV